MIYKREEVNGTSPLDLKKINDNFRNIWAKLFGDISFSDADTDLQKKILTQYLSVQGEGNLSNVDGANYPLNIRFYIPPNVKKIKSSSFNLIIENYRMDSSVTKGGGGFSTGDLTLSMQNGGGATVSSTSGGGGTTSSTSGGGGSTTTQSVSQSSGGAIPPLSIWLDTGYPIPASGSNFDLYLKPRTDVAGYESYSHIHILEKVDIADQTKHYHQLDKLTINQDYHYHDISHSHGVSIGSHYHDITLQPHTHNITVQPHTHSGSVNVEIPSHEHNLKAGVFVATDTPQGINVYINDNSVGQLSSLTLSNQDWTSYINIGQWNVIKITTSNLARATLYGSVEFIVED